MISTIPHMDIYGNTFLEMESNLNLKLFEPDYDFVDKINNNKNSLWTAKVHEEFIGRTYSYMRKILGISNINSNKESSASQLSMFLESEIKSSLNLEDKLILKNRNLIKDRSKVKNQTKNYLKDKIKSKLLDKSKSNSKLKTKENLKVKNTYKDKIKQFVNYSLPTNTINTLNSMAQISSEGIDSLLNSGADFNQFSFMAKESQKNNPISHNTNHESTLNTNSNSQEEQINNSTFSTSSRNGAIPTNFDWRNVSGVNYDSPIRKQGECGSCYAIAAISVVESRIRIKTNNSRKPILSVASAIACSRYNQGCEGGYPYLVGKYGREHGFVNEACQKYNEDDAVCKKECFKSEVYKISDYGYVGDYYGGCSEEAMMREIFNNGPIVVAINASPELYYYSGGIFTSTVRRTEGKYEKKVRPWEFTNHAVVCVGWGEDNVNGEVVKYWILKNSWGKSWGDSGYFKLKKGMASADAQGVFLTPDI
jgi:C1A family cysteine protease